ncbi:MAG: VCBS repeat-containing protein, partial [Planctomycetes bacterium]|nr:VCBS repeat-containing protein [Planctomycetota bacterium]
MLPRSPKQLSIFCVLTLCFSAQGLEAQQQDWYQENAEKVNPTADGWPSEALHDAAKDQLERLLQASYHADEMPDALFADDFSGTALVAERTKNSYQQQDMTVVESVDVDVMPLLSAADWYAASMVEGDFFNTFFKIISVDLDSNEYFGTSVMVHAPFGKFPFLNQINQEFYATWFYPADKDSAPLLRSVRLESYQQTSTAKPLFSDVSAAVFSKVPRHRQELLHGVDKYINKTDRIIGSSLIGSQGMALGDVNGDGLDDIYLAQQGGLANRLYIHQKDGSVIENAASAGVDFLDNTRGVLLCDFDNDGDQDLAVAVGANILIAYNDGTGIFTERAALRMTDPADVYSMTAGDPDNDGDLDIYACRYVLGGIMGGVPTPYHDADNGAANFFWRNDGNQKWTESAAAVGLDDNNHKFSMAAVWHDLDDDGDLDLYVSNDFGRNNLYINDGQGHFSDQAIALGADDI